MKEENHKPNKQVTQKEKINISLYDDLQGNHNE